MKHNQKYVGFLNDTKIELVCGKIKTIEQIYEESLRGVEHSVWTLSKTGKLRAQNIESVVLCGVLSVGSNLVKIQTTESDFENIIFCGENTKLYSKNLNYIEVKSISDCTDLLSNTFYTIQNERYAKIQKDFINLQELYRKYNGNSTATLKQPSPSDLVVLKDYVRDCQKYVKEFTIPKLSDASDYKVFEDDGFGISLQRLFQTIDIEDFFESARCNTDPVNFMYVDQSENARMTRLHKFLGFENKQTKTLDCEFVNVLKSEKVSVVDKPLFNLSIGIDQNYRLACGIFAKSI